MIKESSEVTRRNFLKAAGLTGTMLGLTACGSGPGRSETAVISPTAVSAAPVQEVDIDGEHAAKTQAFLDGIGSNPSFWGTPLEYRMEDGVKVFELTCQQVKWEVAPGKIIDAFTYNGIVPGPEIRVVEGDTVRIIVHNEMTQSTVVHWHGVLVPNSMDGVPMLTQPLIKSGDSFTYEFKARNPGSHMYHSHHNALEQVLKGMLGAFIIEPKDKSHDPEYDTEYTLVVNDSGIGFSINGKSFPYTQPIIAKVGERLRIRYMNEGLMIHPMHLHGLEQLVFSKDGWNLPQPYYCDTVNVAPGERYDVIVDCHTPGAWAFHCHILSHADTIHGMFGMVTAVIVQE
ncbi:MAG: FtsP/CotA-like multicopper oxidase with cupredoxin domain [Cellvibrionaceae bacterium]|jgi:FtsP/CotA-like multicopper oxidase with cupredoxin domain